MPDPRLSHPARPRYWMQESSGILKPVIEKFLQRGPESPLTEREIQILSLYFQQWVDSPVWDENPHADDRSRLQLSQLRSQARQLKTSHDVDAWIDAATREGMDPL